MNDTLVQDPIPDDDRPDETVTGYIGPYRILSLAGYGAMGNVFHARDTMLDRDVAVKVPRVDVIGNRRSYRRFMHEARLAASLKHPGLVEVFKFGESDGNVYLATRWCPSGSLAQWMERNSGRRDPTIVATFMIELCDSVAHCHDHSVLHLDIKPGNILLEDASSSSDPGQPLLSDFGLARVVERSMTETQSSMILGTPHYMSPEQAEGRREDFGPSTDIFALGVVLHELLYDQRPFVGDTTMQVLDRIRSGEISRSKSKHRVPNDINLIWQKCIQPRQQDRYESAHELTADLQRFLDGRPIEAKRPSQLRRFWIWSRRPERIPQSSMASLMIHLTIVIMLILILLMLAWDAPLPIQTDVLSYTRDFGVMFAFFHFPAMLAACYGLRGHRWAAPVGLSFGLGFLIFSTLGFFNLLHRFDIFRPNSESSFLMHLALACFAAGQCGWLSLAMPAVWVNRKSTA